MPNEINYTLSRANSWLITADLGTSTSLVTNIFCTVSEKPFEIGRVNAISINGTCTQNGNNAECEFTAIQTEIPRGTYFYDIKVERIGGIFNTIQFGRIDVI